MQHLLKLVFTSYLIGFISCISQKRYQELLVAKDALKRDLDLLQNVSHEKLVLADSIVRIHRMVDSLVGIVDEWKQRHDALLRSQLAQVEALHKAQSSQDDLVRGNVAEQERLRNLLAEKTNELYQKSKELRLLRLTLLEFKGTMEAFKTQTNLQPEQ